MRTRHLLSAGIAALLGVLSPGGAGRRPGRNHAGCRRTRSGGCRARRRPGSACRSELCGFFITAAAVATASSPPKATATAPTSPPSWGARPGPCRASNIPRRCATTTLSGPRDHHPVHLGPRPVHSVHKMAVTWKGIPKDEIPLAVAYLVSKLGPGPAPAAAPAEAPAASAGARTRTGKRITPARRW